MLLTSPLAPQNFSCPTASFAPSNMGTMFLLGLQQQLMTAMTSLLGSLLGGGSSVPTMSGGLPSFGSMGAVGAGSGLNGFLGGFNGGRVAAGRGRRGGGGGNSPAAAPINSDDNRFTTLNVNIKSRPAMAQNKVLSDVRKASRNADLIGWNEISLDRYRDAIKSLGPEWGHFMPKDGKYKISNPISYRKDEWKMLGGGYEKAHDGAYGICPDRYITWAKLKHKGSGEKIVRINTHTVAGAFSKGSSHNAWRRSSWNTHMKKLSAMVSRFEKQGFKVVIGGDFNKDSSKVLGNGVGYANKLNQSTTDGGSTLDYLMHTRGNGLKSLNGGVLGGFNSDHHAVRGNYSLR